MSSLERHDWLAGRVESPIDPNIEIVDAHHHLWDRGGSTYLAEQLHHDARIGHNIVQTVFVECAAGYDNEATPEMAPVGETRFVLEQAERVDQLGDTEIAAIVSHADMTLGDAVTPVLEAHIDAGGGRFRGIRHGTNWSDRPGVRPGHHNPTDRLMADARFRSGVAALGRLDLSFDAWIYHTQLVELAELARAVPETTIVLDHLGGPLGIGPWADDRQDMLDVWRTGIAEVASCDNVVLKVGGIGMDRYYGMGWKTLDTPPASDEVAAWWRDIVHRSIDAFGPSRCLFESNFPVDRETLPYTVLWNALQILADPYDESERRDLFAGTARRAYRISSD